MSANADLITVETRGNNLKTSFSYMGQNVQKCIFWASEVNLYFQFASIYIYIYT